MFISSTGHERKLLVESRRSCLQTAAGHGFLWPHLDLTELLEYRPTSSSRRPRHGRTIHKPTWLPGLQRGEFCMSIAINLNNVCFCFDILDL